MAEECAESSVAISTSAGVVSPSNWWDLHPTTAAAAVAAAGSSALSSWCHHHHRNNNNTNTTTINNSGNIPWHNIHHAAAAIAPNPNSNSDEDVSISTSFTNASNHSGLTVESSRRLIEPAASSSDDLMAEQQTASDNHIWSHVLLNVGNNGELHNHNQDVGENFLDMLSSSSTKSNNNNSNNGMYEPLACDYLKKLDTNTNSKYSNSWDDHHNHFSSSNNNNNFDDQKSNSSIMMMINTSSTTATTPSTALINESMVENERLTNKLSNLISTWSIAPPDPLEININTTTTTNNNNNHYFNPDDQTCNISLSSNSIMEDHHFPPCNYLLPSLKLENHSGHGDGDEMDEARPFNNNIMGYNNNNGSFMTSAGHYGMPGPGPGLGPGSMDSYSSCASNVKNFADVISFGGRLGKPFMDLHGSNNNNIKPCINKSLGLSDSKKQGLQTSTPTKGSGRGQGNTSSEGKKKRSDNQDNNSETSLKKPKQENSTASSAKIQVPKVKLGDRITALQQIVSPFGKTDTASVLYEAIQYIKFLQEQVKLLSNPYMKTNSHKDAWGSLDRNIKDHHHHHHQNQQNNQMMMVMKGDHHHHQNHQNNHHVKLDLRSRGLCLVPLSCTPQVYRDNTGSDYWTPTYRGCLYR